MTEFSIIIPIYNVEHYIDKCMESILDNNYSFLEIILLNDASLDNSLSICKLYEKLDKRIKVINLDRNGGVVNAVKMGLKIATKKYIAFIDSDDFIAVNYFDKINLIIEQYNCCRS